MKLFYKLGNVPAFHGVDAQHTLHHVYHYGTALVERHAVAETTIDVWHLKSLDAIVYHVGHEVDALHMKLSRFATLLNHTAIQLQFLMVKSLSHLFGI